MKKTSFYLLLILSQLIGTYALLLLFLPQIGVPSLLDRLQLSPISMNSHFIGSGLALMIGPWLFRSASRRTINVHRYLGRIYMIGVLIGGLSGFYMGLHSEGGVIAQAGFTCLALLWLATTYLAYSYIRAKRVQAHRKMMRLNFSLTFAAVTLRLYMPIGELSGLDFNVYYGVIAWLCWLPNFMIAVALNKKIDSDTPHQMLATNKEQVTDKDYSQPVGEL